MDIRLNKLLSDAEVCSRREADQFIADGRVTVNGKRPKVGQRVTAEDIVAVDGEELRNIEKYLQQQEETRKEEREQRELINALRKTKPEEKHRETATKTEKFGRYNKYAAARKAHKEGGWKPKTAEEAEEERLLREALRPQFGKSLRKSAVAQRIAANPKSAALRKTSRNNPINKAKRSSQRRNKNR